MNEQWHQWLAELSKALNYPLIEIGETSLSVSNIFKLTFLVVLVLVAERHLRGLLRQRVLARPHLNLDLQYAISRFAGYCFIALGFSFALKAIHLDLSAFAVIFGALGIGVGFGLQNIVSNFISGLIILAERPIAIGHRVEVSGVTGQVTQINLRSTTVVTNDNIAIIVPNSNFITNAVTNWSYGDPKIRMRLPLSVAYGTELEKLRTLLLEVAAANPSVLKDPKPSVRCLGFGENSLNFELAVWTIAMADRPTRFRSDLFFAIERILRENKIEIPFPQREIYLRSGKLEIETKPAPSTRNP